jgi:hypothetical protein
VCPWEGGNALCGRGAEGLTWRVTTSMHAASCRPAHPPCLGARCGATHLLLALPRVSCGDEREGACAGWAGRALKIRGDAFHALMSL